MTDKIFINAVKTLIANYFNNNVDVTDGKKITTDDVYIVWSCMLYVLRGHVGENFSFPLSHSSNIFFNPLNLLAN